MQRFLLATIGQADAPMTFADIFAVAFPEGSYEADLAKVLGGSNMPKVRSLRRALKKLCDDGAILSLGKGGRGDPYRYCLDPIIAAIGGTKEQFEKAIAVLESDPAGRAMKGPGQG
jgi:hypothetical protein